MSTRNDAIIRVANKIYDVGTGGSRNEDIQLTDTEIGEEVDAAVMQFGRDRPLYYVKDITAVTSPYYATSTLTNWVNDWSVLVSVEWQAEAVGANYTPQYVDINREVAEYQDGSARYLRFRSYVPASGDTTRFRYTVPYTLSASVDTIPVPYFDPVCDLAASYCCIRLASKFAKSMDPTIAADAVQFRDSQLRFRQTAEDFRNQYKQKIGVTEPGEKPASVTRDWDLPNSLGGTRMQHPGFWRGRRIG